MSERMLIKNANVVNPAGKSGVMDIFIKDGLIEKMGPAEEIVTAEEGIRVIDATGLIVAPGLIDVHVHFRDPGQTHKEDIFTGAKAAAHGGFTSVVMMANTVPTIDSVETLEYVKDRAEKTDIHVYSTANVTYGMMGEKMTDMQSLYDAGAIGFTDDGKPIMDEELVREAMKEVKRLGVPISFHEEDPAYVKNPGYNHGKASEHYGIYGADRQAEIVMIERDIELALETGADIDIQHISTAEGVELVRQGRTKAGNIHAEATPHHFTLTEEAAIRYGTNAKMNPPIRTKEDRMAIIRGLQDGTIEMIATDHAPHHANEKKVGDPENLTKAPSGITGLETSLALGITELVKKGYLTMEQLIDRMSTGPARIYHLNGGVLAEGKPADIVIFDDNADYVPGEYFSKADNTPFTGWKLKGLVRYTISDGQVVYRL